MGAPILHARSMFPVQATYTRQPLPPVDDSPVLRVLWADLTPSKPSAALHFARAGLPAAPVHRVFRLV